MVEGYRDPNETTPIPDVTLTGDEFLHMLAVVGETLPGTEPCHYGPGTSRGFWKPGCRACEAIMAKSKKYADDVERLYGVTPGVLL